MQTYISLMKATDQGIKKMKDFSKELKEGMKPVEALGGKLISFYTTMGEYDYIAVVEYPNDEAAMLAAIAVGSIGNVRTTTLKAFHMKEFEKLVKKLP